MALNTSKYDHLTPLPYKGLTHGLGWVRIFQFVMGWVGSSPATKIGVFYSHVIGVFIIIIILIY